MSSSGAPSEPNPMIAQALALAVQDAVVFLRRMETIVAVAAGVVLDHDLGPARANTDGTARSAGPATIDAAKNLLAAAVTHLTTLCDAAAKYGVPKQ
jgi:hypothetical protein